MSKDVNPVTEPPRQSEQGALARTVLVVSVMLLAAADLGAKAWAGGALADGHTVDL